MNFHCRKRINLAGLERVQKRVIAHDRFKRGDSRIIKSRWCRVARIRRAQGIRLESLQTRAFFESIRKGEGRGEREREENLPEKRKHRSEVSRLISLVVLSILSRKIFIILDQL